MSIYNTNSTLQELSLSQAVHFILMNIKKKMFTHNRRNLREKYIVNYTTKIVIV